MALTNIQKRARRAGRTRSALARKSGGKVRLSVFRSSKNISAQLIDDAQGRTLASASSLEKDFREDGKGSTTDAAAKVGTLLAERAKSAGVEEVVFDRGGYIYHGRVKALADAAREGGLKF
ncbi:50S ribosomal protein L18 [Parvularcula dongshanensis]|uniref:Large ribosomal subunit protein uL18 n=1 Tax=Parvularcula dongshanensis TaxID=1173995 RepID=A0A840I3N0_9PROT|nr:50S ribosomal protein L18 [Parvularcula dongshanensis]MBB4658902.1 large subunit ribosomal protein L18 [Parvularcula dongshanensis]